MPGLEDRELPTIPKSNDSLGGDLGLENTAATVDSIIINVTVQNVLGFPKYFMNNIQQENITILPIHSN